MARSCCDLRDHPFYSVDDWFIGTTIVGRYPTGNQGFDLKFHCVWRVRMLFEKYLTKLLACSWKSSDWCLLKTISRR
jgi:hypothetical protein